MHLQTGRNQRNGPQDLMTLNIQLVYHWHKYSGDSDEWLQHAELEDQRM